MLLLCILSFVWIFLGLMVWDKVNDPTSKFENYLLTNNLLSIFVGILYSISWWKKFSTDLTYDYGVTISKNFNSVNVMWIISMISTVISIFLLKKIIKERGDIKLKKDESDFLKISIKYNYVYLGLSIILYLFFRFNYGSYL